MVTISAAGNAETAALSVLLHRGFSLEVLQNAPEPVLIARDGVHEVRGGSAIEVLGLVSVLEARGEDWGPNDDEVEQCVRFWTGVQDGTDGQP